MTLRRIERFLVRIEVVDELDDAGLVGVFEGNLHRSILPAMPQSPTRSGVQRRGQQWANGGPVGSPLRCCLKE
jgi:hypothetical protein